MHEVLVNRLGGLSLPRKSVVRLTDRPDMTLDVYRGRKTTNQQNQQQHVTRKLNSTLLQKSKAACLWGSYDCCIFPLQLEKAHKRHTDPV